MICLICLYLKLSVTKEAILHVLFGLLCVNKVFGYLLGTLLSSLSILCFLSLVNLFIGSQFIFQLQLFGGLLLFCGFVLYDTQLIVYKHKQGDKDFVWHSVDLFVDFIAIFRRIMIILAQNKDSKKKKN